jgi:hypothetical protein
MNWVSGGAGWVWEGAKSTDFSHAVKKNLHAGAEQDDATNKVLLSLMSIKKSYARHRCPKT